MSTGGKYILQMHTFLEETVYYFITIYNRLIKLLFITYTKKEDYKGLFD